MEQIFINLALGIWLVGTWIHTITVENKLNKLLKREREGLL